MDSATTKTKKAEKIVSEKPKMQRQSVFYSYVAKRSFTGEWIDQVITVCLTGMGQIWARGISIQSPSDEHDESEGRKWAKARATAVYKRFMLASCPMSRDEGKLLAFPVRRKSAVKAIDHGECDPESAYYAKGMCPANLTTKEKKLIAPILAAAQKQNSRSAKPKKIHKPDPLCQGCAILCENRSLCSLWKNKDLRCREFFPKI